MKDEKGSAGRVVRVLQRRVDAYRNRRAEQSQAEVKAALLFTHAPIHSLTPGQGSANTYTV